MGAGEVGGIGFYNYDSFSLETKHGWMQTGYGGQAAHAFGEALAQLSADFAATDDNIGQGFMRRRLPEWTGQAARGANEALDAVSVAVAGSGRTGQAGGGSADEYGISFTNTKNQIPEPPSRSLGGALAGPDASGFAAKGAKLAGPVGGAIGFGAGAAVDWVKELTAYHKADQRANDVLKAHEGNTRTVLASFQQAVGDDSAQRPGATPPPGPGNSLNPGPGVTPPGGNDHPGPGGPGQNGPGTLPGGPRPGVPGQQPPGSSDPSSKHPGVPATPQPTSPTVPSSWSPPPSRPAPVQRPDDLVPGPNDSLVPRANLPSYRAQPPMPTVPPVWPGANPRPGPVNRPMPQRTPGYAPPPVNQSENLGGAGAGAAANAERGGGMPMGGMGAGAGAQEREHRNKTFIPDDSPFRFTDKELGVVPAVITADNLDDFL